MKFGHVILYVQDVRTTVDFYSAAFGMSLDFIDESGPLSYAQMKVDGDGAVVGFVTEGYMEQTIKFNQNRRGTPAGGFEISFLTDDVQKAYDHALASGAIAVRAPMPMPWGQIISHVLDNNGVIVEISSHMKH